MFTEISISMADIAYWLSRFVVIFGIEPVSYYTLTIRVMTMACVISILSLASIRRSTSWFIGRGTHIAQSANPVRCVSLMLLCSITGALAVPCNSLLFFLRIKGIYHDSRLVLIIFSLLWLSTWSSFLVPVSLYRLNKPCF